MNSFFKPDTNESDVRQRRLDIDDVQEKDILYNGNNYFDLLDSGSAYHASESNQKNNMRRRRRSSRRDGEESSSFDSRISKYSENPSERREPRERRRDASYESIRSADTKEYARGKESSSRHHSGRKRRRKSKKERIKSLLSNFVFYAVIVGMLAGSVMFALNSKVDKSIFGYRVYSVLTHSMEPSSESIAAGYDDGFAAGAAILVKLSKPAQINVGDVITYVPGQDNTSYLTHRVVKIMKELNGQSGLFFVTRGDANNVDDPPFPADRMIGRVMYSVPNLGFVVGYIQNNMVKVVVLLAVLFCLILSINMLIESRKKMERINRQMARRARQKNSNDVLNFSQ